MAERPEDLNLPLSVITRIMKDAIPDGISVSKEARNAVSKAASVFVLYATSCANTHALKGKRKTLNATDVFAALDDMEFSEFIEPLRANLEVFRASLKNKKEASEQRKKNKEDQDTSKDDDEGEEEDEDEEEDDEDDMEDEDDGDDDEDDDVAEVEAGGGEGAGEEPVTVEDEEAESPEVEEIVDK
ncbi:DNA polymerase epsilon subunit 3-like [Lytechinus variegatus]|uniref:DNA polymerase epsilon subunit 3-like n=1 Tax=Lytechinus variegatus TaxID=7654 RepID=UPI001BB16826|nr:DNA polymerase epsilon subunit 3-like [Lytechinus variegatus]